MAVGLQNKFELGFQRQRHEEGAHADRRPCILDREPVAESADVEGIAVVAGRQRW